MKTTKILMLMAALTLAWGCTSSDDDEPNVPTVAPQVEEEKPLQLIGSTFATSAQPAWSIDWTANDAAPNWEEPMSSRFDCSMQLYIEQDEELGNYSSDDDVMAIFINGECRGVSYRNVLKDGEVAYVLHVKGSSEETNAAMEMRYYSAGLHQLFVDTCMPPFVPNNLMDKAHQLVQSMGQGSTKYPVSGLLSVILPDQLPFIPTDNDMLAAFVGNECRGIGYCAPELYPGWRLNVFCRAFGETAQLRYYSAEKGGVYTILQTVPIDGDLQQANIIF